MHGIGGCASVDCTITPALVSGNTQTAAVVLVEESSDMMLDEAASQPPTQ